MHTLNFFVLCFEQNMKDQDAVVENTNVYIESRKGTVDGFVDRNPYRTMVVDDMKHIHVPFSENNYHKLNMCLTTFKLFTRLYPRPKQSGSCPWKSVRMMIDTGSTSIWDATFDTLLGLCALSMCPFAHKEIPKLHTTNMDIIYNLYHPILVGIAKRIRQHINVIIVNDTPAYSHTHTTGRVSVISTIPCNDELSVKHIDNIQKSVFIYLVLSNNVFYTVVINVQQTDDTQKMYRYLQQAFLLTNMLQIDNDILSFYTRFIPTTM